MARGEWKSTDDTNPIVQVLYRWFFDNIQVDQAWVSEVRRLATQGDVVYILRNLNFVDFLALDHLTKRYDLPKIGFVNDLKLGVFDPTTSGWLRLLSSSPQQNPAGELQRATRQGESAALFLKRPPGMWDLAAGASGGRGLKGGDQLIGTLLELQKQRERPILLVPQVFVWTKRPDTRGTKWYDLLLGPREWPSPLRTIGQFLYNYKFVELKAGEPLNLRDYLHRSDATAQVVDVRRVTYIMLRRLERERRVVTGPAVKPPDRQRDEILRSPNLQKTVRSLAGERPQDRYALTRRAHRFLRSMQATPDGATIKALELLLDWIFHHVYAGIDADHEGLDRLRERCKDSTLVLLPSHKSHIDYLILSYVFNDANVQLPLIAAGDNLSFFPLGPILRRGGGFFIRRSFGGDRLYSSVVEAYIRRLVRDGYALEVFLEGGRSRTGKLLPPKFGLLRMLVDAALSIPNKDVYFIPVSIGYERIVETESYGAEMLGGEKAKEDAAGLLKSTEVLRHRYGRINVQFGQMLTLDDMRDELQVPRDTTLTPPKRRAMVVRLGNRVMDEINRVTAVTPGALTALALLSDHRRGLTHDRLLERCERLFDRLRDMDARITPGTARADGTLRPAAIREAAQMFVDGELLDVYLESDGASDRKRGRGEVGLGAIYRVPEQKRIELDTSKNIIVHFFVERALVAIGMQVRSDAEPTRDLVRERVQGLSRLFKHEFRFRADAPFDEIFDDTLRAMAADGEIQLGADDRLEPGQSRGPWGGEEWLLTHAWILRNFLESYRVTARGLNALLKGPLNERDLVKRTIAAGNRMYMDGELELKESISKPIIENALRAFVDEGYLTHREGKFSVAESFDNPAALRAVEGRITGYLTLSPFVRRQPGEEAT